MESLNRILGISPENTPGRKTCEPPPEMPREETDGDRRARILCCLGVTDNRHTFETMRKLKGFMPTLQAFRDMAEGTALFSLLMVYGGTGNGKTRCCEATVIWLFDRGLRCRRDRWSDVVRTMKSHFNGRGDVTYEEYFKDLRSRQRLIFDDVGSGSTLGQWECGELEDIVDYRYERRLFTIITTNMDIKAFPERILSRFRDKGRARLILNEADDQRPFEEAGR